MPRPAGPEEGADGLNPDRAKVQDVPNGTGAITLAITFAFVGVLLVGIGFWRMYTYNTYEDADKVVGGDAYNYIILGLRGLGFIGAGVGAIAIGALSGLIGLRDAVLADNE
jgi:hypothetical protein